MDANDTTTPETTSKTTLKTITTILEVIKENPKIMTKEIAERKDMTPDAGGEVESKRINM